MPAGLVRVSPSNTFIDGPIMFLLPQLVLCISGERLSPVAAYDS